MPPHDTRPPRRAVLAAALAAGAAFCPRDLPAITSTRFLPDRFRPYWDRFRERFLRADGRIVDTGNGERSHSEGQGWGMLFAAEANDRAAFDAILTFTLRALRRPEDGLFRWVWLPDQANPTPDNNNATDGDIYICWALLRAADIWGEPGYRQLARGILEAIERHLTRRHGGYTFLLPGIEGFEHETHWTLNPSYGVLPAWRVFARHGDTRLWRDIASSHLRMLGEARFGRFGLPPDWLRAERANGGMRLVIAPEWPPRFSYDAVRTPLLLAWDGHISHPVAEAALAFWNSVSPRPAWFDLGADTPSPYPASPGIAAIADLLGTLRAGTAAPTLRVPRDGNDDYYSSALRLLCVMAANHLEISLGAP